mgnify:CR=1 FL=1
MQYLLDTDIIIDFLKNQQPAITFLQKLTNQLLKTSVITLSEIGYGIEKSYNPGKKKEQFNNFISDFSVEIVPIDTSIAEEFVKLKISLEKERQSLADFDLLIAATALTHKHTLVTRNTKHFSRIKNLQLASLK